MKKFYGPNPKVYACIEKLCLDKKNVLEIGPGHIPFSKANHFCGWDKGLQPIDTSYTVCDVSKEKLPFKDKEFDFIYCRHVLEDLYNPFLLLDEMSRVASSGYLETPSPLSEVCRGIDGGDNNLPWRGYQHHHSFVWSYNNEVCFAHKYPAVEYFHGLEEEIVQKQLEEKPYLWNSYHLWNDKIKYRHYQHDVDFVIWKDYVNFILQKALIEGVESSTNFYNKVIK
jgi:ubiquinone/menaquinone biosynthesis C-methylase UbiE